MTAVLTDVEQDALQRRTLNVLRLGVVPGQAAVAGVVAVVSLLGKDMLGSDRLAGLGSAAFTTGSAIIAIPLAARMKRRGRRSGLVMALTAREHSVRRSPPPAVSSGGSGCSSSA